MTTAPLPSALIIPKAMLENVDVDVDMVLTDSFPASDPPSWTPGNAETGSSAAPLVDNEPPTRFERGSPAWLRTAGSILGAAVIALGFPLLIVLIPLALAWRLILEVGGWPRPRPAQ